VGFVHELSIEDIKKILGQRHLIKPRRQMFGAVLRWPSRPSRHTSWKQSLTRARLVYNSVQAATNGIEFAKSPSSQRQRGGWAALRLLQFDGIGNAANSHRSVGNLFDVKLQAIENLYSAGVNIVRWLRSSNGVNNQQVGRMIEFALDNPKKISLLSFQPVVVHRTRRGNYGRAPPAQRYTLSHLARDVRARRGLESGP